METPIAFYRCYFLGDTRHIIGREDLHADDDASAVACCHDFWTDEVADGAHSFELWENARKVHAEQKPVKATCTIASTTETAPSMLGGFLDRLRMTTIQGRWRPLLTISKISRPTLKLVRLRLGIRS